MVKHRHKSISDSEINTIARHPSQQKVGSRQRLPTTSRAPTYFFSSCCGGGAGEGASRPSASASAMSLGTSVAPALATWVSRISRYAALSDLGYRRSATADGLLYDRV